MSDRLKKNIERLHDQADSIAKKNNLDLSIRTAPTDLRERYINPKPPLHPRNTAQPNKLIVRSENTLRNLRNKLPDDSPLIRRRSYVSARSPEHVTGGKPKRKSRRRQRKQK